MSGGAAARRRVSPYARKLARERGIGLDALAGSGPSGRIVAADVVAFVPRPALVAGGPQASALATSIDLAPLNAVLGQFVRAETAFELDDVILRAAGCALDDVPAAARLDGAPGALETRLGGKPGQLVFRDIRKGSLGPLRERRLAALATGTDQSAEPAALSIRLLGAAAIRPVMLPLLPDRAMRLVLAIGGDAAEALLVFDAAVVDEDAASEWLVRFKAYLEVPLRLLA